MKILLFILFAVIFATNVAQSNINAQSAIESGNVQAILNLSRRVSGRITNGTIVRNISEFPYQVGIASYDTDLARYWCGGSLISNQWILTAAHCLIDKVESVIYIGLVNKDADHQFQVGQSNYILHKNYVESTKQNDIALIKLPIPVQLSNTINTITVDKDPSLIKWVNKDAVVSGWGASFTGGFTNSKLQYAEVKILSNSKCIQAVGSNLVTPSKICQKVINNKGICQGDSGGPLAATENGKRILIGITSFIVKNLRQCETDTPRVFTRVASYHKWICDNTEKTVC